MVLGLEGGWLTGWLDGWVDEQVRLFDCGSGVVVVL